MSLCEELYGMYYKALMVRIIRPFMLTGYPLCHKALYGYLLCYKALYGYRIDANIVKLQTTIPQVQHSGMVKGHYIQKYLNKVVSPDNGR